MKIIIFFISLLIFTSCQKQDDKKVKLLEKKVSLLEEQLTNSYQPGFGEMMSSIQAHHSKLWFAGKNKNWQLANFEVKELNEILEDIEKFQQKRPETTKIKMIYPALKAIDKSVENNDLEQFKTDFKTLTNECNQCHRATNFGYNVVKIPENSPFTNQEFKVVK